MNRRVALLAAVAGVALVAISVLADTLGVGGEPGFGWKQGIGVGVGALVAAGAIGFLTLSRTPS